LAFGPSTTGVLAWIYHASPSGLPLQGAMTSPSSFWASGARSTARRTSNAEFTWRTYLKALVSRPPVAARSCLAFAMFGACASSLLPYSVPCNAYQSDWHVAQPARSWGNQNGRALSASCMLCMAAGGCILLSNVAPPEDGRPMTKRSRQFDRQA
jgi:hypothetical protein